MDKGLVSIIIPNYNYARYLRDCIDSVIRQSYKNWELIVVDDNSTDNSRQIVKNYIKRYPQYKIKLLHNKRGPSGTATPVNMGIRVMRGEFFAWLSSDDIFHPEKLEKQLRLLQADPQTGMVYSRTFAINDQGAIVRKNGFMMPPSRMWFLLDLVKTNFINGNTVVIRKDVLDKAGFLPERSKVYPDIYLAAEYYLWLRICMLTHVRPINEALHYARVHSVNSPYMKSGLGEKQKGYFIAVFFKEYSICRIADILGLTSDEQVMCEAMIRKEMERCGYGHDCLQRHDLLLKECPSFEKKVIAKEQDLALSDFLMKSVELKIEIGKTKEAMRYLKRALALNPFPRNFRACYGCASYLKREKRVLESQRLFKKIIKNESLVNSSYRTGALFHLGEIYYRDAKKDTARNFFSQCLEEAPEHRKAAEYLRRLGVKCDVKDYWDIGAEKSPFKVIADIETKKDFELSGIADANMIIRHIGKHRLRDVLEIGCGMGRIMKPLSHVSRKIVGVDRSREMIRQAESYLDGIHNKELVWVETESTPFEPQSFDVIYSHIVFMHMARKRFISWVKEAHRLLKPDGVFWFQMFSEKTTTKTLDQNNDQAGGTRAYSSNDLEKIAGKYFQTVKVFMDKLDRYEGKCWSFCICKAPIRRCRSAARNPKH